MKTDFTRRGFLGAGALGIASAVVPLAKAGLSDTQKPKNIIFMVSDGMSIGVPSMVDHYLQLTTGRPSFWRTLMESPEATLGLQDTRSLNSVVTDSAAASSSWGCGRHVVNGSLNMYPDGTKLRPLFAILGEQRMRRGLVSTTTITDATPAGFATSILSRTDQHIIAEHYLESEIDVILGGGDQYFAGDLRKDHRDLYADFSKKGYRVARDKASLESAGAGKLLGIFSKSSMPFRVDRQNNPEYANLPGLEQMARIAIDCLKGSSEGFILQIEGARIDHAAHANDFAGLIHDQIEFDQTMRMAVEWAREDGETLVVITSDHGNSNPGLDGQGSKYADSTAGLLTASRMTRSYESLLSLFSKEEKPSGMNQNGDAAGPPFDPTIANVQSVMERDLGIKLTDDEAQWVVDGITGKSPLKNIHQYDLASSSLAMALSNHTCVGWTGRQHTDAYVPVTAVGPGRELFAGLNANVSFHGKLLSLRGLKDENPPQMSKEDAEKAVAATHVAFAQVVDRHWV